MRYFLLFTIAVVVAPLFGSGPAYNQALNLYKRTEYQASLNALLPIPQKDPAALAMMGQE